jgi:drug/metabolite transporter (DMT)-like permease
VKHREGVGAALLAAVLFGLSTPLAKGLLSGVQPQLLGGLFYLGSGLGLSLLGAARGSGGSTVPMGRYERWWLAAAILCGGILAPPLQLVGIQRTPTSTASLLLNFEGVFTALLAWVAFREHVNARTAAGMAFIVAGGAVLAWTGSFEWQGLAGALAICGACLLWGLDNNFTQKVSGQEATRIAAIKGLVAGTVNSGLALAGGSQLPAPLHVCGALVIGFLSYGLSLVLFVLALRGLGTARTGAYFSLAPFVGAFVGLVLWREPLTGQLVAATALMALGLGLHLTEHHEHPHTHEELVHAHGHVHDEHHQHAHGPDDPPGEPHTHRHRHEPMTHSHPHYPDLHHRHGHSTDEGPNS